MHMAASHVVQLFTICVSALKGIWGSMIDDIDEALRQLLVRDLPVKNNEVDSSMSMVR